MMRLPRSVHFDRMKAPAAPGVNRRQFMALGAGAAAAGVFAGQAAASSGVVTAAAPLSAAERAQQEAALEALGRSQLRGPLSRPFPVYPAGTDTMPGIDHIVVLMLENHSYDNIFGMLKRGDGFTLDKKGLPTETNPYGDGRLQKAFLMPTTCQLPGKPSQEWKASHVQYANGNLDGFVQSDSGPVAMGYWTSEALPYTYALAEQFPIGDRWFCSVLGQTDPNRRYLIAATSAGMTDDIGTGPGNLIPDLSLPLPGHGTIFDTLGLFGISWADYCTSFPLGATAELYPIDDLRNLVSKKPIAQFFTDCAAGKLPSFTIVDPDYSTQSQENPQDIVLGEQFMAKVVNAIGASPAWLKTLLIVTYDEHGGYFDHVAPPPALAPDALGPLVQPGESAYEGFKRYGFRVPSMVISPYAKRGYVSSQVYDHTSILALVQRKWNLPALTYRDANANDLTDFIDIVAMSEGKPTFAKLPQLPEPNTASEYTACLSSGAGVIPPAGSIIEA